MGKTTLKIEGMTCGHCVQSLTEGLSELEGVRHVEVTLDQGQASVEYDEGQISIEALRAKVSEIGYRAV
jgi:copper chaperone